MMNFHGKTKGENIRSVNCPEKSTCKKNILEYLLWCRWVKNLTAAAWGSGRCRGVGIQSLVRKLPYASSVTVKKKKKKEHTI